MIENDQIEGLEEARYIYIGALELAQVEEQALVNLAPDILQIARITCSAGFNIASAVNKSYFQENAPSPSIPGQVENLHRIYHVLFTKECDGLAYSFSN